MFPAGSGKTHTLQGKAGDARGIVPRVAEAIFARVAELTQSHMPSEGPDVGIQAPSNQEEVICDIKLSVMEIYQERLRDLLSPDTTATNASLSTSTWNQANGGESNNRQNLRIRETGTGSVWVEGLTETTVNSVQQFTMVIEQGLKKRVIGSHSMNKESSRYVTKKVFTLALALVMNNA